ncbi:MAG: hypothetical protein PHQ81_04770 [Methanofollis sp.]|nr:hypothetical protein [Methanofollis sp.]
MVATRYVRPRDPVLRALIDHHLALVQRCGGPREWEAARRSENPWRSIWIGVNGNTE